MELFEKDYFLTIDIFQHNYKFSITAEANSEHFNFFAPVI